PPAPPRRRCRRHHRRLRRRAPQGRVLSEDPLPEEICLNGCMYCRPDLAVEEEGEDRIYKGYIEKEEEREDKDSLLEPLLRVTTSVGLVSSRMSGILENLAAWP